LSSSQIDRMERLTAPEPSRQEQVLIIGAGLAGLFLALRLKPRPCLIISPASLGQAASSSWAQGGLAAALDPADSPAEHARDTIAAGHGLVDPAMARMIAEEGPERVYDLIRLGVPFDRTEDGQLALSLEAAHSHPRVARVAGDLAGKAIMQALSHAVRAADHIELIEHSRAVGLLQDEKGRIAGAILRDRQGRHRALPASETVLCTGGTGGLFRVTTNPAEAQGDALAMAWQKGAVLSDPEFIQFHPTAMDVGLDPSPLATEALRGEGASLINSRGEAFMSAYHDQGELAPRDIVARAIQSELGQGRQTYLDTRQAIGEKIADHFPTVFAACQSVGLDPRHELIPVAPAMHYHMGGVLSDLWGRSSLNGLSVCGECASSGAHGANRLASNSLLEAVVMAARIADRLREDSAAKTGPSQGDIPPELPQEALQSLRVQMADHCGVVREEQGLTRLLNLILQLQDSHGPAHALITAELIVRAALSRRESRGGHYRSDFPHTADSAHRSFYTRSLCTPAV